MFLNAVESTPITEVMRFAGARLERLSDGEVASIRLYTSCRVDPDLGHAAGMLNGVGGLPFSASPMNSVKIGTARPPPVAVFPMFLGLSKPI